MKIKTKDEEIECTVEEYFQLKKINNNSEKKMFEEDNKKIFYTKKKVDENSRLHKRWDEREKEIISNESTDIKTLCSLINRTRKAIAEKFRSIHGKYPSIKKRGGEKKHYIGNINRMRYIHSRIKNITRDYNYNYEKAFRIASDEWKEKKNFKKKEINFPKIYFLDEKEITIIKDIMKTRIANNLTTLLSFDDLNKTIFLNEKYDGFEKKEIYNNILIDIMKKSSEICEYLGIKEKPKIIFINEEKKLVR